MWAPRTWSAVQALIGSATESTSLDLKRELTKNTEIAKDIAAMTVNGGVLVYGVDEDKTTATASAIVKFALAGVEERLQQVIGSNVAPAPELEIVPVRENDADADGVVVVVVPPSSLAPHMANDRFPVRRGTTTDYLTEPEVARLYERRLTLTAPNPQAAQELLADFGAPRPIGGQGDASAMFGGVGRLRLAIAPAVETAQHPAWPWLHSALQRAYDETVAAVVPRLKSALRPKELDRLDDWVPRGTVGWTVGASGGSSEALLRTTSAGATLIYPARLYFQATWPLDIAEGSSVYRCAHESSVALAAFIFCAYAGRFLTGLDGVGPVRCAIALEGFQNAVSFDATGGVPGAAHGGLPVAVDHMGDILTTVPELRDTPDAVARRLIDPWLVPFYEMGDLWAGILEPST